MQEPTRVGMVDVSNPVSFFTRFAPSSQFLRPRYCRDKPAMEIELLEKFGFSKVIDYNYITKDFELLDELLTLILSGNDRVIKSFGYLFKAIHKPRQGEICDDLFSILHLLKKCTTESDYPSKLKWINEKLQSYGHADIKSKPSTFKYHGIEFKLPPNCLLTCESANLIGFYNEQEELNDELIANLIMLFPSMFVHAMTESGITIRENCFCFLIDSKGNMKLIVSYMGCLEDEKFSLNQNTKLLDLNSIKGISSTYSYFDLFYDRFRRKGKYGMFNHELVFDSFRCGSLGQYCGNYETILSEFYQFLMKRYAERKPRQKKKLEIKETPNNQKNNSNENLAASNLTKKQLEMKKNSENILRDVTNFIKR
ncbi:predicted protein [Naegleria gruberi]|uniref:Predicted protein n=1 Tax=Naegleria gruberi TaxID=5762 RepID=D2V5N0_NAEGR|nr:uncharacterized protein NAEGRDRAFT_78675 [Naegleria gruberi]EFC47678.1 predicted protein [Naegleria gruberi]|eukprot:XP_002680422.1 predicted protein [Naegleria gruberi strain NEG-M]